VLARLNAMHTGCPVNGHTVLGAPDVSTPVRVLEIGFERTWFPGVRQAVAVDSKSGLAVAFLRTEEAHIYVSLGVCPCFNISGKRLQVKHNPAS